MGHPGRHPGPGSHRVLMWRAVGCTRGSCIRGSGAPAAPAGAERRRAGRPRRPHCGRGRAGRPGRRRHGGARRLPGAGAAWPVRLGCRGVRRLRGPVRTPGAPVRADASAGARGHGDPRRDRRRHTPTRLARPLVLRDVRPDPVRPSCEPVHACPGRFRRRPTAASRLGAVAPHGFRLRSRVRRARSGRDRARGPIGARRPPVLPGSRSRRARRRPVDRVAADPESGGARVRRAQPRGPHRDQRWSQRPPGRPRTPGRAGPPRRRSPAAGGGRPRDGRARQAGPAPPDRRVGLLVVAPAGFAGRARSRVDRRSSRRRCLRALRRNRGARTAPARSRAAQPIRGLAAPGALVAPAAGAMGRRGRFGHRRPRARHDRARSRWSSSCV